MAALNPTEWISKLSSTISGGASCVASPTTVSPSTGGRIPKSMGVMCSSFKLRLGEIAELGGPYRASRGTDLLLPGFDLDLLMKRRSDRRQMAGNHPRSQEAVPRRTPCLACAAKRKAPEGPEGLVEPISPPAATVVGRAAVAALVGPIAGFVE